VSHRIALCAALFLLMDFAAAKAQQVQPTAPSSSASQASPTPSSRSADQPASAPAAANSAEQPRVKKVWTNDDVTGLRSSSAISTVGTAGAKPAKPGAGTPNGGGNAKWYASQIMSLQAKLPPLDAQIAELHDAIAGKPTGDGKTSTRPSGVKIDSWSDELTRLEQRRDAIQQQIEALREQARRHGVPDSALPL
jgi:hypothetical protein